jgi:hypothetical protein
MSALANCLPAPATESALRLELFDSVPPWAVVHAARDDTTAPLIRKGEVAVVDSDGQTGWLPEHDGLFLVEYVTPAHGHFGRERRTRAIVQTRKSNRGDGTWYAAPYSAPRSSEEAERELRRGRLTCVDGPYPDAETLADKLIGRVVGLYRPR